MINEIKNKVSSIVSEAIQTRRHLHANPELSFKEFKTSEFIQNKLTEFGIPFTAGIVETGIVALIRGNNPNKKTIALRADIDALPIVEKNEIEYASINSGVMHACGHDVHTTCVLYAAKILNEYKSSFEGTIKIIFQPGEEKLPGGASLMIKENALKNPEVNAILGQHVFPDLPVGKLGFRKGMYMASCDEIYVTVTGKGGHAALPHTFIDPIYISSVLITTLQQVVSRHCKPDVPCVLSFGKINSNGGATNIIPDKVFIEGTFRTMDEKWRKEAHSLMKKIAEETTKSMGGICEFKIEKGYPFLKNDVPTTEKTIANAKDFIGSENVVELDLRMTAEDFSYYTQQVPGCFYRLGTGESTGLHTSTFNVDEKSIEIGIGFMVYNAIKHLNV